MLMRFVLLAQPLVALVVAYASSRIIIVKPCMILAAALASCILLEAALKQCVFAVDAQCMDLFLRAFDKKYRCTSCRLRNCLLR
eukprot:2819379-Alexandrium_andersonii.AAC.1